VPRIHPTTPEFARIIEEARRTPSDWIPIREGWAADMTDLVLAARRGDPVQGIRAQIMARGVEFRTPAPGTTGVVEGKSASVIFAPESDDEPTTPATRRGTGGGERATRWTPPPGGSGRPTTRGALPFQLPPPVYVDDFESAVVVTLPPSPPLSPRLSAMAHPPGPLPPLPPPVIVLSGASDTASTLPVPPEAQPLIVVEAEYPGGRPVPMPRATRKRLGRTDGTTTTEPVPPPVPEASIPLVAVSQITVELPPRAPSP
jgi:hypothetical protein